MTAGGGLKLIKAQGKRSIKISDVGLKPDGTPNGTLSGKRSEYLVDDSTQSRLLEPSGEEVEAVSPYALVQTGVVDLSDPTKGVANISSFVETRPTDAIPAQPRQTLKVTFRFKYDQLRWDLFRRLEGAVGDTAIGTLYEKEEGKKWQVDGDPTAINDAITEIAINPLPLPGCWSPYWRVYFTSTSALDHTCSVHIWLPTTFDIDNSVPWEEAV